MSSVVVRFVVAFLFTAHAFGAGAQQQEVVFGVYPYLTPTQIVEQFAPLRQYLAETLGRPVTMVSAPDFPAFIERTKKGEYDLAFTAPHMGRLAEKRDGYRHLAQTGYQIVVVVLARRDGGIASLDDLRGGSIAVGSRNSMTWQIVVEALKKRGLAPGKDIRLVETASFSNVMQAVLHGEATAAGTGTLLWDTASDEQRRTLRAIYRSAPVPGFLLMAGPRLDEAEQRKLREALPGFGKTPGGAAYFRATQHLDFRPVDAATMKRIDPFVAGLIEPQ